MGTEEEQYRDEPDTIKGELDAAIKLYSNEEKLDIGLDEPDAETRKPDSNEDDNDTIKNNTKTEVLDTPIETYTTDEATTRKRDSNEEYIDTDRPDTMAADNLDTPIETDTMEEENIF